MQSLTPLLDWLEARLSHLASGPGPVLTLSWAQTLDGSLSARPQEPLTLSGPETRRMTHALRARHEGILVGVGTILADDPLLTVRELPGRDPQAVILDPLLRTPAEARLFSRKAPPPWILHSPEAPDERRAALGKAGARLLEAPRSKTFSGFDLEAAFRRLKAEGLGSVMIEGGPRLLRSCLEQHQGHQAVVTVVTALLGGFGLTEAPGTGTSSVGLSLWRLKEPSSGWLGGDLVVWGAFTTL